jgi:23S rRNA (adenine2503-C2)-methyltransferase
MTMLLKDHPTEDLATHTADWGLQPTVVRKLQSIALKRRAAELPPLLDGVARHKWERVLAEFSIPHLTLLEKAVSPTDGFAKYLFRGEDGAPFEAVRIPLLHRPGDEKYIVCVSSQVGCAARCSFCETGKLGFRRQLRTWEIVDQVVKIQEDSTLPVRGVVFMGMGEPLLNYDAVMRAARILSEPSGMAIDGKAITISTVGVAPMIRRFTREKRPYRLIVSVHAATAALRDELVPMNLNYSLPVVIEALRERQKATRKRAVLAWTMIAGVNMNVEELRELKRLTTGLDIMLDLIPVNDPSGRYRPPTREELSEFLDLVRAEVACPIVCRYSGGADVHGACGMLAGRSITPLS